MRTAKQLCLLLLLITGGTITATSQRAIRPTLSSGSDRTYYVIQNAGTKEYLCSTLDTHRIWTEEEILTAKKGTTSYTTSSFLWFFEDAGSTDDCIKIGNKHASEGTSKTNGKNGSYLLNTTYALTDNLGNFDGSGSIWYLSRFDFNESTWAIHDASNMYWKSQVAKGDTYIEPANLTSTSDDYFGWILRSYDELVEEAKSLGVVQSNINSYASDKTSSASFKWLINQINIKKSALSFKEPSYGRYLLKNRRFGTYLNSNGDVLNGTCTPTEYSVWKYDESGQVPYLLNEGRDLQLRTGNSTTYWDLQQSQAYTAKFAQSSDKLQQYVKIVANDDASKYMGMQRDGSIYKYDGTGITGDWEFIPLEDYLSQVGLASLPQSITADSEISEEHFYHIANVAQNFDNRTENTPDTYGWLTDLDYVYHGYGLYGEDLTSASHTEAFAANTFYAQRNIDTRGVSASTLWQFIRIGRGSTGGENATGLLSPEHDVFLIKNANSNKYISSLDNPTLTTNKSEAGMFYLLKHMDGQFSLMNYTGTSAGKDSNKGALSVSGTSVGSYAGISKSSEGKRNDASSWIIVPTPKIRISFLVDTQADDGFHWSTFYFPFDVVKAGTAEENAKVEIYAGGWVDNSTTIRLKHIGDAVPAGNAVVVRSDTYDEFDFYAYPTGIHPEIFNNVQIEGNIWKGVAESEGTYFGGGDGKGWKNYWILYKSGTTGQVKLLHPADDYLMPNRAYLDKNAVNSAGSVKLDFFEDDITGIDIIADDANRNTTSDGIIYDLQGRRVTNPTQGIYIRNGKKVMIR